MAIKQFVTITVLEFLLVFGGTYASDDPCGTNKVIDEWQRSISHETVGEGVCDNFLVEGWYRVTSGAGEKMPVECPEGGFRCGTNRPIYIGTDGIPDGENVFPAVGETITRTVYEANYDGNCKHAEHTIQIKGCDGYFVYHLKPVTGCFAAYCFGKIYVSEPQWDAEVRCLPGGAIVVRRSAFMIPLNYNG